MNNVEDWLKQAEYDLRMRLEMMGKVSGYGQITIIFNLKQGEIIDYQIGENLRKKVDENGNLKTTLT